MKEVIILSQIDEALRFPSKYFEIANEGHFWCQWRFSVLKKQLFRQGIAIDKNIRVLDLGCGNGLLRRQIERETAWISDGCDIDLDALRCNDTRLGDTYYYNIYEKNSALKNLYDVIILFDVLEHIEDTTSFMNAILYHLKPDGIIIINVPAFNVLRSSYDDSVGHVLRYTKKAMRDQLFQADVKILSGTYWGFSLILLLLLRKLMLLFIRDPKKIVEKGFAPPSELVNKILLVLMKIETKLFAVLPCGTSLMVFAKRII